MISECVLVEGSSRERMFDCLRLSFDYFPGQLEVVFKGKTDDREFRIPLEIEGIHRKKENAWFFWGKLPQYKFIQGLPHELRYAFGWWDTQSRRGRIKFGEQSFFTSALHPEEEYEHLRILNDHFRGKRVQVIDPAWVCPRPLVVEGTCRLIRFHDADDSTLPELVIELKDGKFPADSPEWQSKFTASAYGETYLEGEDGFKLELIQNPS